MSTKPKMGRPNVLGADPVSRRIEFPRHLYLQVRDAARADGVPLSRWIREAAQAALATRKPTP